VTTYLDRILEWHRARAADDDRPLDLLIEQAIRCQPARGFCAALSRDDHLSVISEIKRRSPSKGDLNPGLDPALLAKSYEAGGASCLSVLTDGEFFGGSADDLRQARQACEIPVLRKDFIVGPRDVVDARLMGADCVLLIAAAMPKSELADLHQFAVELGLDVLVEIHDERELDAALAADASLIGVNQRDLVTFEVDHERAVRLVGRIPTSVVRVAESGVRGRDDARALHDAGYDAVLVGESIVTADDPGAAVGALIR
jgi:indole-3-glycerol phosphate synthase